MNRKILSCCRRLWPSMVKVTMSIGLLWLFCSCTSFENKKESLSTVILDGNPEIGKWYVCGAFGRQGCNALEEDWISESILSPNQIRLRLKKTYEGKSGKSAWRLVSTARLLAASADLKTKRIRHLEANAIDLLNTYPKAPSDSSAYALAFVESAADCPRALLSGSDDGIHIWLNGKEILSVSKDRPLVPDEDFALGKMRKGLNILLVKVDNDTGYWGFSLRFLAPQESHSVLPAEITPDTMLNMD